MATLLATADGLEVLVGLLERSLSHDAAADEELSRNVAYPDYAMGLLSVLATKSSKYESARQAASLHFKRLICQRWPKLDGDTDADQPPPLPDFECSMIKLKILGTFLNASPSIQAEVAEALVVIAASDFPANWTSVLPSISSSLGAALGAKDFLKINPLLSAAGSIFLGLRQQQRKDMDYYNIDYCISGFADILLGTINFANQLFQNPATATHPGVFECLRLCFQIIHSLNSIDLHDKFKPVIGQWMSSFLSILTSSYPTADGRLDLLRATLCDNLQLLTEKYGDVDVVSNNLGYSVTAVLDCLMSSTAGVQLLVSGIKFITAVAESTHRELLESAMEGIYNGVIIPNLQLRDEDEYLFNGNWIEYVRLDSEVSDTDTPRRAACQLLRVLATNYREHVDKFVSYMWNSYSADLANNWKQNDAVIHLILALGKILGGPEVDSFFTSVVQPELLRVSDHLSVPMLKATALRFLKEFIDQISIDKVQAMLPHMVRFLNYESSVVHSYAAIFTESLLNMDGAAFVPKVTSQIIESLSGKLFVPASYENPYLMKCLMHLLMTRSANIDLASACDIFSGLVATLKKMCVRPKDSEFNNYMFEALKALIERFGDQVLHPRFFDVLANILNVDILPFVPYTCKLFAWAVRFSNFLQHQDHADILDILLNSAAWHRPDSAAACLCLLRVFLQPNNLDLILLKFEKLLQVSTQESAVGIVKTIVEDVEFHVIEPYLERIWNCLFDRLSTLQSAKRAAANWANSVISFMSIFIVRYGNTLLVDSTKKIIYGGVNLTIFIKRFWTPSLRSKSIKDGRTIKMSAVASIILLRDNEYLHNNLGIWAGLLDSSLVQILRNDVQYEMDEDLLLKDKNPELLFCTSLVSFSKLFDGRLSFIISTVQLPKHRDYLLKLLEDQNINIV